jgi:protocatechuate 3,4-dioxygenase beta subunit
MRLFFQILLFYLIVLPQANAVVDDENLLKVSCSITPELDDLTPIPAFVNSNNLRRSTGSTTFAEGQPIIIKGKVLDANCAPVSGAVVQIWQANADGIYEFMLPSMKEKNTFGTGTAVTDNLGNYSFISVLPGGYKRRAPHVNFRITHADFLPLITEMFFADHPANYSDRIYVSLAESNQGDLVTAKKVAPSREDDSEFITYIYDIVLKGSNRYIIY